MQYCIVLFIVGLLHQTNIFSQNICSEMHKNSDGLLKHTILALWGHLIENQSVPSFSASYFHCESALEKKGEHHFHVVGAVCAHITTCRYKFGLQPVISVSTLYRH